MGLQTSQLINEPLGVDIQNPYNKSAKAVITMTELENEIVNGNVYIADLLFTLAAETSTDIGIITPSDTDIRIFTATLGADLSYVSLTLYEGVTFTGNAVAPYVNANRQSDNTGGLLSYSTFTVAPNISGATQLKQLATVGGSLIGQTSIGSTQSEQEYILLKRDTKYLFRFYNANASNTATVTASEKWIETDLTD